MPTSRPLSGLRLAVAGGGVLGLSVAAMAAREGARVTVFEPLALGDNASGVAAGMLSPAFEAVLDRPADYRLYRRAYDAWAAFAAALKLEPSPILDAGALYVGADAALERVERELGGLGVAATRLSAAGARTLQPGLAVKADKVLHVAADGRLDPLRTLQALAQRVRDGGGEVVAAPCPEPFSPSFDAIVLAAGFETRRWADRAPELATLHPIKGHVLHFRGGPGRGPVVRSANGYAAPQEGGTVFGSTMELGRADLTIDPDMTAHLHAAAAALFPALATTAFTVRTGVRAATQDGRPLVGRSAGGLHLAVGARRNGWLLAPLIAAAALEGLQGGSAWADFDPAR